MNPYEILGVSPDDDEETIKKAYRALVKKYHPDRYVNNPLSDLAGEKIKEINKAYDMIMNRKSEAAYSANQSNTYSGQYSNISFQSVRALISSNRISEAQMMLNSLPRTAEWYYLTGVIHLRRGWYNSALDNIKRAVQMEPGNMEYQEILNNIRSRNTQYTQSSSSQSGCCNPCNCCGALICLDCCC